MSSRQSTPIVLILLVFVAFVSLGLPDAVQGVAWPMIRADFNRSLGDLSYLLIAGASGYFTSGALGGIMMQRLGVGRVLAISTGLVTLGLVTYALTPNLWAMIPAAFVIGIGSGAVDAGLNFYAADTFSVRTMTWLHACFGIGSMLGPIIMSLTLGAGASWRWGYAIISTITLLLTITFFWNAGKFDQGVQTEARTRQHPPLPARVVLRMPLVWLQIAFFFVMTAAEVIPSVWTTTILLERFHIAQEQAGIWVGVYWGTQALGRFVLPVATQKIASARVIQVAPFGILVGSILMALNDSWSYRIGIMVVAFSNAIIFPMLMSLTPGRIGRAASVHAIGWQVSAATVGGALVPSMVGIVSGNVGLFIIPISMVVLAILMIVLEIIIRHRANRPENYLHATAA